MKRKWRKQDYIHTYSVYSTAEFIGWLDCCKHLVICWLLQGSSTPFDLDTYLGNFRELDEWEIMQNVTAEVKKPREVGVILMRSRRKSLRMTLTLRRRTGFLTLLLTIPCVALGLMSCLIFCIPPTRPDRLSFGKLY